MRMVFALTLTMASSVALASPNCAVPRPNAAQECKAKLDYCHYTSIVVVLAYRSRLDGKTEDATISTLSANKPGEVWYARNPDVVKDIVHQTYSGEAAYQKMKRLIGPTVLGMAQAISQITSGCDADTKVKVESK